MGIAAAIGSAIVGVVDAIGGAGAALGLGLVDATGAATSLGAGISGALLGGGLGAGADIIEGKPVLPGLLEGGITGGAIGGVGPLIGGALGGGALATGAGDVLAGAGGGALGGLVSGQSPLGGAEAGALSGGVAGLASGVMGGSGGGATPTAGTSAGVGSAGAAAPAGALPTASAALGADLSSAPGASFTSGSVDSSLPTPPIPPFGTDASGISTAPLPPAGAPNPGFGPGSWQGGADPAAGVFTNTASPLSQALSSVTGGSSTFAGTNTPTSNLPGAAGANSAGGIGSFLKSYGAPLAAVGGIGLDLLKGTTPLPNQGALSAEAGQLATQGNQLSSYLATGTLPPGVQQSLNSAAESAKAAIRSRYAQMGGDTSAMQQDLANVDQVTATQGATIATQLLSEGVSETGLSEQIYSQLLNLSLQQNSALSGSIGNFATALAGGGRPVILQSQGAT